MPKIRLILEDVTQDQADLIQNDLKHLPNIKVTVSQGDLGETVLDQAAVVMAEMTPEQHREFEEEWNKSPGHITWLPRGAVPEPGPAIGERLDDIDEQPKGMPILPPGWSQDINTGMVTDDHGQAQGIPLDWSRDAAQEVNERYTRFRDELEGLVNRFSMENGSDTPDFLLAAFLVDQLRAFDHVMRRRDEWYGGSHRRLKAQLEAEGEHTAAANAEIERLLNHLREARSDYHWKPDEELNRLLDRATQST